MLQSLYRPSPTDAAYLATDRRVALLWSRRTRSSWAKAYWTVPAPCSPIHLGASRPTGLHDPASSSAWPSVWDKRSSSSDDVLRLRHPRQRRWRTCMGLLRSHGGSEQHRQQRPLGHGFWSHFSHGFGPRIFKPGARSYAAVAPVLSMSSSPAPALHPPSASSPPSTPPSCGIVA